MLTTTRLFSLILIAITVVACSGSSTTQNFDPTTQLERPLPYPITLPKAYDAAIKSATRSTTGAPGEAYWQQYANYDIKAFIDTERKLLEGDVHITYTNNSPDTLQYLVLELALNHHQEGVPRNSFAEVTGGYSIHFVTVNGDTLMSEGRYNSYTVNGTMMYIAPPKPVAPKTDVKLQISWHYTIPKDGASGRMGYDNGNLFYLAYWYPHMAVYDDVFGWHTDQFLGLSEFYHGFADYTYEVTAPEQWIVMGTGDLLNAEDVLNAPILERWRAAQLSDKVMNVVSEDDFGAVTPSSRRGELTWKFKATKVNDVAFGVMSESIWDATRAPVGDITNDGNLNFTTINAFYRTTATRWKHAARYGQHSIDFLSRYTSVKYPWPHMTLIEAAGIINGGMEYPMMTIMGAYNRGSDESLYAVTAHEIAHMWIPLMLASNERRYSWFDEGWTSFHENQAKTEFYPGKDHNAYDREVHASFAQSDMDGELMRYSNFHYTESAFGVASYMKPSSILHALREVLGQDVFDQARETFMQRWMYKHPYPWDFFRTIEDVSGQDLNWFWRSWYYERWQFDQGIDDIKKQGKETVITIKDHGMVPMPVILKIAYLDGTNVIERREVNHWLRGKRSLIIRVPTLGGIKSVTLDPNGAFPDVNRRNNFWELPR